jgi:hypothetical protein
VRAVSRRRIVEAAHPRHALRAPALPQGLGNISLIRPHRAELRAGLLISLVYNFVASTFGGLELEVE